MNTIKIWNDNPSDKQLKDIAAILDNGLTAIIPTDTMYALVCDATNMKAIERICKLKGINPEKTNLSILCSDISMASEYARIDNNGFRILKEETPGPITLLFKTVSSLPRAFKNRKIVGIRIPNNNTARKIVEHLGRPLLSTTIQYEDEDYAVNPDLIAETYDNKIDLMVDAGQGGSVQSRIIDCTGNEPVIIRD